MKRDWFFLVSTVVVLLAVLLAGYFYLQKIPVVEDQVTDLNSLQQSKLDLFQQRVGVLLTISTLVVGGAAALLFHFYEKNVGTLFQHRLAVLALQTGGCSAFLGYLAYDAAIWMLDSRFFNLDVDVLWLTSAGQLWLSVVAIVLLVVCFLSGSKRLRKRK